MSIAVEHPAGPQLAVLSLTGEHDLATATVLRRALNDLTDTASVVVLDLRHCAFVDSTILGVLVAAAKRLARPGSRLVAINAQGIVAKALHVTGLDALLFPQADLDEGFLRVLEQLTSDPVRKA